ncbi:MAG: hypothetical protein HGB12_02975 [Bacteroidetes bacterium]|nr:hypothetical protein [Bacteroidota bacterium]
MTINPKFKVGQEVTIRTINIDGFVTGLIIRDNGNIEYEVSYFLGDNYYSSCFSDYQIEE